MATADDCIPQVGVCRTRVASLDTDGSILGGSTMYVSDALLKVTFKPNYENGDEIKEKNGCGDIFIDYKGPDSLLWYDIELEFLTPDPYLHAILLPLGHALTSSSAHGFAFPEIGTQDSDGVSLEFWCKRVSAGALSQTFPYAHWALPLVKNLRIGDRVLDANAQHSVITGQAFENANWFDGPGQDWPSNVAPATSAVQWIPVTTQPAAACGPSVDIAS